MLDPVTALLSWARAAKAPRVSVGSLQRDVECCLRTYLPARRNKSLGVEETLDCPLVELGLLRAVGGEQALQFHRGSQIHLPDGVLFFAIMTLWGTIVPGASSLSLPDLTR